MKDDENKLDGTNFADLQCDLEKVLCDCYDKKTVPLTSIDKKLFYSEMCKMTRAHETYVKNKGIEKPTLEMMPNHKMKHVHKLCVSLSREKIMHIENEHIKFNANSTAKIKTKASTVRKESSLKSPRRKTIDSAKSSFHNDHYYHYYD